jgi:TonB family protein
MGHEDVPVAFFSYCRDDSEFALKLAADLKSAGAHVWIDQLDIEPGTPWDRAVEDALTHSPRMLVVLSPVSVNSDNVRDEVSFALSRQKRVIPVLYRDCEVPFRLARLQHIDFRPDYDRALAVLIRALGVGQAAHAQMPSSLAVEAAAGNAAAAVEAQEREHDRKLEEDRRFAEEQAQLEQARAYAAEQARLKRERQAAAEQAEQQRAEEDRARTEQSRREQRAAEQARLEQEARLAAERVRLAQEEKDRRQAEIKVRQEQLRREEQESVERKSISLEDEAQSNNDVAQRTAPADPSAAAPSVAEAARSAVAAKSSVAPHRATPQSASPASAPARTGSPQPPQSAGLSPTSPKILGGIALLAALVLIIFVMFHRSGPEKSPAGMAEKKATGSAQPLPAPGTADAGKQLPDSASSLPQTSAIPANTPAPDKPKPVLPDADLTKSPDSRQLVASNAASTPNRVRITQNVARALLMHEIAPTYPPLARSAHVQGQVALEVVIGKDGSVKEIKAKSGHPMLVPAAIDAVKKWSYQPFKLNGKPVEAVTEVIVNFTLTT